MQHRHSFAPILISARLAKAARKGGWAMRAGDSWVVRIAVAYGLRGGRCTRGLLPFVRCWGRMEACGICIPAQAANRPSGRTQGGARPQTEVRLRAPCCIGRHVGLAHTGGACIECALGRTQGRLAASAPEQTIRRRFGYVERGLLWRFVQIRFARAKGRSPLKLWSR